jgi:hypothetical protein
VAAVALSVTAAAAVTALIVGPQDDKEPVASNPPPPVAAPMPSYRGGDSAASCVGAPKGDWLRKHAFAFDGTVLAIEEPAPGHSVFYRRNYTSVTFKVNHWYKAGGGAQVRILMPGPADPRSEQHVSAYGVFFELGSRLLVSGNVVEGVPASQVNLAGSRCGFCRSYDRRTVREWLEPFGERDLLRGCGYEHG